MKYTSRTLSPVIFVGLFFLAVNLFMPFSAYANNADTVDAKLKFLIEQSEKKAIAVNRVQSGVSLDETAAIASGDWTALAQYYPSLFASQDLQGLTPPSVELLSSWWDILGDEQQTSLIKRALNNNRNLQTARLKVVEARAQLGISKSNLLPWLDGSSSWGRSKSSSESGGSGKTVEIYRLKTDASWEIDIFGGRRQAIKADAANLEAQYANLHAAWVSLSAEVALNYISLRTLQERLRIAEDSLALQKETLEMLQSRYDTGLADTLALSQAQYTFEQTQAKIPLLQSSIETTLNAIALLTGSIPGSLNAELSAVRPIPEVLSADLFGIPANALRRRPDIQAAERQLAAQMARTRSAKADLWPKFFLFGSIGQESLNSGSLFSSGAQLWSFGPQITLPLFHGGSIRKNIKVQTARQEQALTAYEQTVLNAVAETRDALSANVLEMNRNASLYRGAAAARDALAGANDRYKNGLSDFNNVIGAQTALLSLEEQYAISKGELASNLVRLFKALGGGWAPLQVP